MSTLDMYDAAWAPTAPPSWPVVAGYIGGDTPHVWTAADWASQAAGQRLPIWVRSNPGAVDATADGGATVEAARAAGVPEGATIALDLETAVDAAYVSAFDTILGAAGYGVILYGSASSVMSNPRPSRGYWVADWTGTPHMYAGATATQYANGQTYDSSLIADNVPLWDVATGGVTWRERGDAMPVWITGVVQPTDHATVVPIPQGSAWSSYPHRALHLFADDYPGTAPPGAAKASVRVGQLKGTTWTVISVPVSNGGGSRVQVDGADTLSLAVVPPSPSLSISYAIEVY